MNIMKLITGNLNYSSWSARAWLAMKLCGIDFEHRTIPLFHDGFKEKLREVSPTGLVPVLQDRDMIIWDSLSITEYLYERDFGGELYPSDDQLRMVARSAVAEMHSGFPELRSTMPMNIRRETSPRSLSEAQIKEIARVENIWGMCRDLSSESGPGLLGSFSAIDIFYVPIAFRFRSYGATLGSRSRDYMTSLMTWPLVIELEQLARQEPWTIEFIDQL